IGHTFAQYLATEYNANLIITSRSRQNIDDKWQQVSNDAANLEFAQVDASDRVAMDAFIQDTTAKYGRIDGVFYLAGLTGEASLRSINETETDYIDSHLISKQKESKF
ncbi:SDR family NAD(P)-dependent oxidoreductase, partial [Xenorhabdus bovienii]|uniref:SDR family NAD(P)-dependent oxidoreductase n=1 Tax=Xenorhabdus bovienii TaxID=40576 RepID=UPI0023B2CC82